MAENKTKPTKASVATYLAAIEDEGRRKDCDAVAKLMTKVTKQKPTMWGTSIVGFGSYHYKYDSGREGDMCVLGFASRKADISIYGVVDFRQGKTAREARPAQDERRLPSRAQVRGHRSESSRATAGRRGRRAQAPTRLTQLASFTRRTHSCRTDTHPFRPSFSAWSR